jgi:hypothetical protein
MQSGDPNFKGASSLQTVAPTQVPPTAQSLAQSQPPPIFGSVDTELASNNLGILASLQPTQIEELLRNNPQLRDVVITAINDAKKASS